jgi:hypothetical protein
MITSKTYYAQAGLGYIYGPELAFAKVYVVKRGGTGQNRYVAGDPNRTFVHEESTGKIYFPDVFGTGETVFVIYKTVSTSPDPEVCTPIEIQDTTMPDAIVNVSYSRAFPLTGTEPYFLNVISKPSWATVEISLGGVLTIMGFPDAPGAETLEFEITNCGGTQSVSKMFTTIANTENIFFVSGSFSRITGVTGIPFTVTTGSFPVYLSNTASGVHNDYTGDISVTVSTIIFPRTLRLYKNDVLMQSIAVTANGTYTFSSASYLESDVIKIYL